MATPLKSVLTQASHRATLIAGQSQAALPQAVETVGGLSINDQSVLRGGSRLLRYQQPG